MRSRSVACSIIAACCCAAVCPAQSFEEFQKSQQAELSAFASEQEKAFAAWKKEQSRMLQDWNSDAKRSKSTSLRNVDAEQTNDTTIVKREVNYSDNKVKVTSATFGADSAAVRRKALALVAKNVSTAVKQNAPEETKEVPPEKIEKLAKEAASKAEVVVEKKGVGYVAKATAAVPLTGKKSVMEVVGETEVPSKPTRPPKKKNLPSAKSYTSVIVDARGVSYAACLIPMFIDKNGAELYGPRVVKKEHAINGMAKWLADPQVARKNKGAGKKPLLLTPESKVGKRKLLFGGKNADLLCALGAQTQVLKECKVLVVVK